MSTARYLVGDVHEMLATLEDNSVDLVMSSPPFLALRSYLAHDHPDKGKEIGSESTPANFIDALLDVVEACDRVLAPHGTLAFELGDTYSGSGGAGGDYNEECVGLRAGQERFDGSASRAYGTGAAARPARVGRSRSRAEALPDNAGHVGGPGWPEPKSLCLIPELFRVALVYGFNPLTGRPTPRWRARNVIRWCRPNPPVGTLGDKVRPATSDMVVACHARDRYFDLDAVRGPGSPNTHARTAKGIASRPSTGKTADDERRGGNFSTLDTLHDTAGAPPLDHWWHDDTYDQDAWLIPTQPYAGSHYATWPEALCVKPIEAMCPRRVCRTCGQPSRRITEPAGEFAEHMANPDRVEEMGDPSTGDEAVYRMRDGFKRVNAEYRTVGWTDCGHNNWRPGLVLDPFAGSGTTLAVATGHGRDAIGIDIDERNAELALHRVGPLLLTIETPQLERPAS
jgi:hypothetical protein